MVFVMEDLVPLMESNKNDIYLIYVAEEERRKSLIKESFGVNITLKETKNYYNNNIFLCYCLLPEANL